MKNLTRVSLLSGFCALAAMSGASASETVGSWYFTPMVHAVWTADARVVDDDFGFSLAAGKALSESWNLELALSRAEFAGVANDDLTTDAVGLNALRVFYRESRIAPFLLLGAGLSESNREFTEDNQDTYVDVGVGILATLSRSADHSRSLSLRGDLRGRHSFVGNDHRIIDYMAGIGLQFAFGGRAVREPAPEPVAAPAAAAPADADTDGDGVVDTRDKCPGTPAGTPVDASGCGELDGDGDGVLDSKDRCPRTPKGDKVDAVGCSLTLRLEVLFESNSDQLTGDSGSYLDAVAVRLNELTNVTGVIEGHTDNVGSDAANQGLSERRARTVRNYLVSKGVAGSRLKAEGLGESKPIADNSTEAGRAQNRRVVLRRTDTAQ